MPSLNFIAFFRKDDSLWSSSVAKTCTRKRKDAISDRALANLHGTELKWAMDANLFEWLWIFLCKQMALGTNRNDQKKLQNVCDSISWCPDEFVPNMASCDWKCFRRRSSSRGAVKRCCRSKYSQFLCECEDFHFQNRLSWLPDKTNLLRLYEVTKSFVIHRDTWGKHRQAAKCAHKTLCPVLPCCLTNESLAQSIATCSNIR